MPSKTKVSKKKAVKSRPVSAREKAISKDKMVTIDGNSAAAYVAHALSEVIAIYPITPSSNMGEIADAKSADGETNIWGTIPIVIEMQSEGGASGAVHGAATAGALTTTFTASQGLLLMIPNMFKIAGEMTSTVFHVSARSVATHALSIFGDHSDVMATRSTGFGLIASGSVQEAMDLALITHAATLESRVPFVHFFDGFRTSHEEQKVSQFDFDAMRAMIDNNLITAHRARCLSPDHPTLKGSSQNPDVFFQARETVNKYYLKTPEIVQKQMNKFAKIVGRKYKLFDYFGAPNADRIVIMMASGAETMHETVDYLTGRGEKVGLIKVRLYRPFSVEALLAAIPKTVKKIAILDRTKEPGAVGEPLYVDVQSAISEGMKSGRAPFKTFPLVVGGRYGLSSKEFNPAMAKAVLDNLKTASPKNHFTVGINDDVTRTSLKVDYSFSLEGADVFRGLFYGLGSDGTVGANKNSIKIIGENTDNYAQGYFVYDSKKAGAVTVSHLRFGKKIIRRPYLISSANFVACHNFSFLEKYDMLSPLVKGGTFLLTSPFSPDEIWDKIPVEVQRQIINKKAKFYVIDAIQLAKELGLGARINMIMQTAFFYISGILPRDEAIAAIKDALKKTYGHKGDKIVQMNYASVDAAISNLHEVQYPNKATGKIVMPPIVPKDSPEFVRRVTATIIAGKGDTLPVSAMPDDGTFMTGTTQYEKRNIAVEIPVWDSGLCTQCGICSIVCPHASIRMKIYDPKALEGAPSTFKSVDANKPHTGLKYTLQIAPEDCTGCEVCVNACPAHAKDEQGNKTSHKAINMAPQFPLRAAEAKNWDFFLSIPETDPSLFNPETVKGSQLIRPLFEFSGACGGCGETPYIKLVTQLFGDRAIIGNATGCSSIYGGNLPTTPYTKRADGRGPAWSNSLFEDNAEFALGMRLAVDKMNENALELLQKLTPEDFEAISGGDQSTQIGIEQQRTRVEELKKKLKKMKGEEAEKLLTLADYLVKKSVWAFGGDGWAYDIGFGGLDHVLASGRNVNLLVLDTEVYSNTGGQMSKSSPMGAVAKFAAAGKPLPKKDLGMIMMSYGNVFVAQVAIGASQNQAVRAFAEAEKYKGPSIIIAYSHCIAHGIDMAHGLEEQKKAVESAHWILYRFNPDLIAQGKNPLQLDSKPPSISYTDYALGEVRFKTLQSSMPERSDRLLATAQADAIKRYNLYKAMASIDYSNIIKKE
jgi:pyruvate-ferredoxin/flavodoxin oxidoreductase